MATKLDLTDKEDIEKIRPRVKELWVRGRVDLLDLSPKLAIVGSRKMTTYGEMVIEKIMPELVARGVVIVSGFMYGVDKKSHRECLKLGGKTIAVLGWGIDRSPTEMDEKLDTELEDRGLFLSEYEGKREAELWMFPARNRIVAGISDAVLIIEAAEKSGSMITADWAMKMKKKLLCIPGNILGKSSSGTNKLIKENKAKMVTDVDCILEELNLGKKSGQQSIFSDPVLEVLQIAPRSIDEIVKLTKRDVNEVMASLSAFELEGRVTTRGGRYYVIEG